MSGDLVDLAEDLAGRAEGEEEVEAYVTHARTFEVRVFGGEVDSLSSAEPRGAGVRVVSDRRVGFAFSTDLSSQGLSDLVAAARTNAAHAGPDEAAGLAPGWVEAPPDVPGLTGPSQAGASADDKVSFVLALERAAASADARVRAVEDAVYADSDAEVALATSTGIAGAYRRTDAWCYAVVITEDAGDTQVGFDFGLGRALSTLDAEAVAGSAARRGLRVLGASKVSSQRLPVVFDPYVAGQFLGVLGRALTGEAVQKGRSLFAGRLGDKVGASNLTLTDDGRLEGAPGAAPWDDEGVATTRTEVIRDGILESFLFDTVSARREGTASTGNAARAGFKSVPHAAPSNLAFAPTGEDRDEVLVRAGRAFYVQDLHGVHSGANPISGDFSVGATGLLVEGGDLSRPVKEVTIAAPMLEILERVAGVASDLRWLPFAGSYGGATTLVSEMTVAGT
jgi:PmbA protein